jgi:signal transduction histidine kinase
MPFSIGIAYNDEPLESYIAEFIRTDFILIFMVLLLLSTLIYLFLKYRSRSLDFYHSNKELSFMNYVLKKFIYAASHDLKQPLVNISTFNELLYKKEHAIKDPEIRKYLDIININIKYLNGMLKDLLIYSKVLKEVETKQDVDLNELVSELIGSYNQKNLKINHKVLPVVHAVKSEMFRLFQNLISNSIKFNNNNVVEIDIDFKENVNDVEFNFSDNGIGIEEEYLQVIFEEFQRINNQKYDGSGLGLSLCKEIVRKHGGKIRAYPRRMGGTVFNFNIAKNV